MNNTRKKPYRSDELGHGNIPDKLGGNFSIEWDTKMRVALGRVLVSGDLCYGVISRDPNATQADYIFLTQELKLADYARVINSKAIICENGGKTGHLASICRILGIPIILLDDASMLFKDQQEVTLDCVHGIIYWGRQEIHSQSRQEDRGLLALVQQRNIAFELTIVDELNIARINALQSFNVERFFLREEFLWVKANYSPFAFLKEKGREETTAYLVSSLKKYMRYLKPGQFFNFRSLDIRSDELRHFPGGIKKVEGNPELGLHGIRKLLIEQEYLIAELQAIDYMYSKGYDRLIFSLPLLIDQEELRQVKGLIEKHCAYAIKVGLFVETPSAVAELPILLSEGLSSVEVGTKDLIQFILACDRNNKSVAHLYNSRKRAVLLNIQSVLNDSHSCKVPAYIFVLYEDLLFYLDNLNYLTRILMCTSEYERLLTSF